MRDIKQYKRFLDPFHPGPQLIKQGRRKCEKGAGQIFIHRLPERVEVRKQTGATLENACVSAKNHLDEKVFLIAPGNR